MRTLQRSSTMDNQLALPSMQTVLLSSAVVAAVVLCGAPFTAVGAPWAHDVLWAAHPALGSAAFVLMTLGLVTYAMEPIGSFAPDRARRRIIHAALQAAATTALVVGYSIAFGVRNAMGKSHAPWGKSTWSKALHIGVGHMLPLAALLVALTGAYKMWRRRGTGAPTFAFPFHGLYGIAVWFALLLCVGTGIQFSYWAKGYAFTAGVGGGAAAILVAAAWQVLRGPAVTTPVAAS